MRIAALGDAHLGRSAYPAQADDGGNQRERDFEESFTAAMELALAQRPDAIAWLGDVFDHPRPSYRSFLVVMRALAKVRDHGVPLVAISGNHDTPRLPGNGNPYAVLADAFPQFTFAHRMTYEAVDLGDVRFHCVPQTKTAEDTVAALQRADQKRSTDRTNVLLTHPLVHGIERRYADINEIEVDADDLRADLVLLGHYHFHLAVPRRERVWYAGATDTFGFGDDPDKAKGIVVLDTVAGGCEHLRLTGQRPLVGLDPIPSLGLGPGEIADQMMADLARCREGAVARISLDGIAPDVYRMLDVRAILESARHLLHVRIEPRFDATSIPAEDLPDLGSIGARWRTYVGHQDLVGFDREEVINSGASYIDAAIDVSDGVDE